MSIISRIQTFKQPNGNTIHLTEKASHTATRATGRNTLRNMPALRTPAATIAATLRIAGQQGFPKPVSEIKAGRQYRIEQAMAVKSTIIREGKPDLMHLKEWSTAAGPERFQIAAAAAAVAAVVGPAAVGRFEFDSPDDSKDAPVNPSRMEARPCFHL
jgi:hypothetical protein